MSKYELRIDVNYATLVVAFDSTGELEQRLKDLDLGGLSRICETYLKSVAKAEPRKVKPVLEGICAFRTNGALELLKPATSKIDAIGLILFAYDPDSVALDTIGSLISDKNPAAYFSVKRYAKLFYKVKAGFYTLSQDGRTWVASEVIPGLRKES